jgi:hypothetical protein
MSNGPIKNCALGICCPPPLQEKALAVLVKESAETLPAPIAMEPGSMLRKMQTDYYLQIARGLIAKGVVGTTPEEAAHLKQEGTPTEEELDRLLAE